MTQQLEHLARAYFHQDFDLEAGSPDGVIELFVSGEGTAAAAELAAEISALLQSPATDEQVRHLWVEDWGASYDPTQSVRSWLSSVLTRLIRDQD